MKVGELPHVTEEGHFIQWEEVKFGDNLYARVEFSPVLSVPEASVTLKKGAKHGKGTLRVLAKCNLHGLWESAKEITVTEAAQQGCLIVMAQRVAMRGDGDGGHRQQKSGHSCSIGSLVVRKR